MLIHHFPSEAALLTATYFLGLSRSSKARSCRLSLRDLAGKWEASAEAETCSEVTWAAEGAGAMLND